MGTPHRCPVCEGQGLVNRPPWLAGDQNTWTDNQAGPYPCKACNGTGIIWETDTIAGPTGNVTIGVSANYCPVCHQPYRVAPGSSVAPCRCNTGVTIS